jgi:hypothetical protein
LVAADMIGVRGVVAALWLSAAVAVADYLIWRRRTTAPAAPAALALPATPPTPVASAASVRETRPDRA